MAHLLIVEDDVDIASINQNFFQSKGHTVAVAGTIKEASFSLDDHAPDLILLDVMLPDGMGWDFCKEARMRTDAPIIFLSARDENESIIRGLMNGGDDYMTKPYDLNVLAARVEAQLRRTGKFNEAVIDLPLLKVDMISGTVTLDEVEYSLPQKELQIMYMLASAVGRRVAYQEIYKRIYGDEAGDVVGIIRVNISRLKKHLSLDGDGSYDIDRTSNGEYVLHRIRY